jgi:hypothetical protein
MGSNGGVDDAGRFCFVDVCSFFREDSEGFDS